MSNLLDVAIAMGEEIQKHGDAGNAIYALRQQLEEYRRDAERYRVCRKLIKDFAPYQIDEKCDAAIKAEKVRTE